MITNCCDGIIRKNGIKKKELAGIGGCMATSIDAHMTVK